MKHTLLLISCVILSVTAFSQNIQLVKDIEPGSNSSNPEIIAVDTKGNIYFKARTNATGYELYYSDGTANGTVLLKDINPTYRSGVSYTTGHFMNGRFYFFADDYFHGTELWESDGTPAGTKMVKDINPGTADGFIRSSNLLYYNGKLYFAAKTPTQGIELWESDGTAAGTKIFVDIAPGVDSSNPSHLMVAFGKMYFAAEDATHGQELWVSDGTVSGTKMVQDFNPGDKSGISGQITIYNNKLYFEGAPNTTTGEELCSSDGNTVTLVKDIDPVTLQGSKPTYMTVAGNLLYFSASDGQSDDELWVTDGTTAGTKKVKDIYPGQFTSSDPELLAEVNGKILFRATDGTHGREMWVSNGTANSTYMLKDLRPGYDHGANVATSQRRWRNEYIYSTQIYNGKYYFPGITAGYGIELWRTDGTTAGTIMIEDVAKTPDSTASSGLNYIFFNKNDMWLSMSDGKTGIELFKYDANLDTFTADTTDPGDTSTAIRHIVQQERRSSLYPNPNDGSFQIKLDNNSFLHGYLKVTDINGRIIYDQAILRGTRHMPVRLYNAPAGIYQVTIRLDNDEMVHNIVVQ